MANCPNCGVKLQLTDWKPVCPDCGVNLNYYNANERLLADSEKAEIEHAHFQPKVDRAKAAYAGSNLAILRIVLTVLPVAALFLPLLTDVNRVSLNIITVVSRVQSYGVDNVLNKAMKEPLYLGLLFLFLSAVMVIVNLVLIIMSLGKHGKIRVIITHSFQVLCALCAAVLAAVGGAGPIEAFDGPARLGVGAYLYIALLILLLVYNIFLLKKGIPVKYTRCIIGGLPSEEYFSYVKAGMSQSEIRRKMLVALTAMQVRAEEEKQKEQEAGV